MSNSQDVKKLLHRNISQWNFDEASKILVQVNRIERKTFPSSEAFSFTPDLHKKPNVSIGLLVINEKSDTTVVAYCMVVRTKSTALLHKICVIEQWRQLGVGTLLMANTIDRLAKGGCRSIQLWVDEGREGARKLYQSCSFEVVDAVTDYYGPGRMGIKMTLALGNGCFE